jgi:hypothetical protein
MMNMKHEGIIFTCAVDISSKFLLRVYRYFIFFHKQQGNPAGSDWTGITVDEFDNYKGIKPDVKPNMFTK